MTFPSAAAICEGLSSSAQLQVERNCFTYRLEAIFEAAVLLIRFLICLHSTVRRSRSRVPREYILLATLINAGLVPCALFQFMADAVGILYCVLLLVDQMVSFTLLYFDQLFWVTLPHKIQNILTENGEIRDDWWSSILQTNRQPMQSAELSENLLTQLPLHGRDGQSSERRHSSIRAVFPGSVAVGHSVTYDAACANKRERQSGYLCHLQVLSCSCHTWFTADSL